MTRTQFWILGPLDVWRGGERLCPPDRAGLARELLGFFLLQRGHFVPVEVLVETLWPHLDPSAALNNAHVTVSKLRRLLEPGLLRGRDSTFLLTEIGGYRFVTAGANVDVDDFDRLWHAGMAELDSGNLRSGVALLEDARKLYRGDLLSDLPYAEWALPHRERFRERLLDALDGLVQAHAQLGAYDRAAEASIQALRIDSLRESAVRQLMRAYTALGRRADALAAYDRCRSLLSDELGLPPGSDTVSLFEAIAAGEDIGTPAGIEPATHAPGASLVIPFVGRQEAVDVLTAAMRVDGGRMAFVHGEAGIGKTRLLREVTRTARATVCWARADPTDAAFGAVLRWVDALVESAPDRLRLFDVGTHGPPLAARAPSLRRLWPDCPPHSPLPGQEEANRLGRAIISLLRQAADAGTVFVGDDWHACDQESLGVLARILSGTLNDGAFLIAFRSDGSAGRADVREWLQRLELKPPPAEIPLTGLNPGNVLEAVRLLTGVPSPRDFSRRLHRVTAGNPLFLTELMRGLGESGWMYRDGDGVWHPPDQSLEDAPLTDTLKEAIRERLGRCTTAEREILDAMAVLADQANIPRVARLLRLSESAVRTAMGDLAGRGLLGTDEARGLSFSHQVIRDTIYNDMALARVRLLHRLAAESLEREALQEAGPLTLHVQAHLHRGRAEPGVTADWCARAGRWSLSQSDFAGARELFEAGLAHVGRADGVSNDVARQLLEGLAEAQWILDDALTGVETLERAIVLVADGRDRARIRIRQGKMLEHHGAFHDRALALLDEAEVQLELVAGDADGLHGDVLAIRASIGFHRGDYREAERLSRRARDAAREPLAKYQAVQLLGISLQKMGRLDEAADMYRQLITIAEAAGDHRRLASAHLNEAAVLYGVGQLWAAHDSNVAAGEVLRALGDMRMRSVQLCNTGQVLTALGELAAAEATARQALAAAERSNAPYTIAVARHSLGTCQALRGKWAAALKSLESAAAEARAHDAVVIEAQARLNRGRYHDWPLGRMDQAREAADHAVQIGDDRGDNFCQREGRLLKGILELALDHVDAAEAAALEALDLSQAAQQALSIARANRLLGQVAAARREAGIAADRLAESERILRAAGARIDLGETLAAQATALRRVGAPEADWRPPLTEAVSCFRRSGARPLYRLAKDKQDSL